MYTLQNPSKDDNSKSDETSSETKLKKQRLFDNLANPVKGDTTDMKAIYKKTKITSEEFNGKMKEEPGLYAYDLHRLATTQTLTTYKLNLTSTKTTV